MATQDAKRPYRSSATLQRDNAFSALGRVFGILLCAALMSRRNAGGEHVVRDNDNGASHIAQGSALLANPGTLINNMVEHAEVGGHRLVAWSPVCDEVKSEQGLTVVPSCVVAQPMRGLRRKTSVSKVV